MTAYTEIIIFLRRHIYEHISTYIILYTRRYHISSTVVTISYYHICRVVRLVTKS